MMRPYKDLADARALVLAVADELGAKWLEDREDWPHLPEHFKLELDGRKFRIYGHDSSSPQHLRVEPDFPRDRKGHYIHPKEALPYAEREGYRSVEIRISRSKTPKVIAAEIRRRFMPRFEYYWDNLTRHIAERDAYADTKANLLQQLADLFGVSYDRARGENLYLRQPFYLRYANDKTVTMEISDLTIEQVKQIKEIVEGK